MRRSLLLSVLFVAATLLACDEDPIAPPTTGSISLRVLLDVETPTGLVSQQVVSADAVGSAEATSDTLTTAMANQAALDARRGTAPRITAYTGSQLNIVEDVATQAEAADAPTKAPAAPTAIDAATIRIIGPTNKTLTGQQPGTSVTVDGLDPGSYTVVLEGLIGGANGEVDYFGRTSVTVTAGNESQASISFNSFRPVIQAIASPSTNMAFSFTWNAVAGADEYYVELDDDPGFGSPISGIVNTPSAVATVPDVGTWYVRASSGNEWVARGRAGDADSVDVVSDIDPSGPDFASAYDLGFGTAANADMSQLNIVPANDEDWYSVDACLGDRLIAEVFAQRLDPASDLNSYLDLFGPSGNLVDSAEDTFGTDSRLERVLTSGGTYYIKVASSGGNTTGNYRLMVEVVAGAANNGTSCSTLPGTTNAWTGAGDGSNWSDPDNWFTGVVPAPTDTISVPATASPVLTENVTIAGLIVLPGGHVGTNGYDLTVTGDLSAGFSITGDGTVILTGSDVSLSGGVPNLLVTGDVSLSGRAFAIGNVQVQGALRMNGYQMAVDGTFSTINGTGVLEMTTDADTLAVAGLAAFSGGETTGLLTAGRLILAGGIRAQAVAATFAPSGTHRVVMAGAADRTITDVVGVSFFNDLAVQTTGTVTIAGVAGQAQISGRLISDASVTPTVTGGNLLAYGVAVQNMVLDNATLLISNGAIIALDGVVFQNFPASTQQLIINRPGGSYTFNNLQFSQLNGASDAYIEARDAVTDDLDTLKVTLAGASPIDGTPGTTYEYDGAIVNWVVAQAGPPSQVSFTVQPSSAIAGTTISPAIEVTIQDASTITVDTSTAAVTIAINDNPAGGTLNGTTTVAAVNGVATFSDLSIDLAGLGYALAAGSNGLTPETSSPFAITPGAPATIAMAQGNNQTAAPNTTLPDMLGALVTDAFGNGVSGVDVTWTVTVGGGTVTATSVSDASGIATASWTLGGSLGANTVEAAPTSLVLSGSPVEFNANAANTIAWLNATSGNWSDGTNWEGGSPPTSTDAALITVDGTYTVTIDVDVSVESVTLGGAANGPTVDANGWTITATGTVRLNEGSVLNLTSSTLNAATVVNEGSLEPDASTINADIDNRSQVVARGSTTFNGAFTSVSTLLLDGAGADVTFTSGFTNTGIIEFASAEAGGYPSLYVDSGTLVNAVGGKILFTGLGGGYLEANLDNRDSLKVESAETVSLMGATITNSGVMYAATADLDVDGAFTNSGTVNIGDNLTFGSYGSGFTNEATGGIEMGYDATLDLSSTTFTSAVGFAVDSSRSIWIDGSGATSPSVSIAGNVTVAAGGTVEVKNNTVTLDSLINHGDFSLDVAHIIGPVNNIGTFNATVGGNSVTGSFYNATDAWAEVAEPGTELVVTGDLANHGTVKLYSTAAGTAPRLQVTGGTLTNYQWFDMEGPAGGLVVIDSLHNNNEIHAMSGGVLTIEGPAIYSPGWLSLSDADMLVRPTTLTLIGDLYINNNHTLTVDGGAFHMDALLAGNGTLDVSTSAFTSTGYFSPGEMGGDPVGVLNIIGDVVMTSGNLSFNLDGATPGTEHDVLNVSGAITLAGELTVTQGFTPTRADTFTVLNFGSQLGAFETMSGLTIDDSLSLHPRYGLTSMMLVVSTGPDSVVVTPNSATLISAGASQQFNATEYADGEPLVGVTFSWTSLNPNIATVDGTGLVTAVASGQATIQTQADGVKGYALVTVAVPGAMSVNLWATEPSGLTSDARGIWGTSASDVYAVSTTTDIIRYDGTNWNVFATGLSTGHDEIWGTSAADIFALGPNGRMRHYDGTDWQITTAPTESNNLAGIWGSSPADVMAVGWAGTIVHFDGNSWASMTSGTVEVLFDVWGASGSEYFAVGVGGTILQSDGWTWNGMTSNTSQTLMGVWGTAANDVFAVGGSGTVLHYDGFDWSPFSPAPTTTASLRAVWGSSGSDIYVLGHETTDRVVLHFDGVGWSSTTLDTLNLFDVWGSETGDVWATAEGGTIYRGVRGATVTVTPESPNPLTSLGDTLHLTAVATDGGGNPISGMTFTWSSDDENIATVGADGIVSAVGNGTVSIHATAPGGATTINTYVEVNQEVASVAVTPATNDLTAIGATVQLSAEALDANSYPVSGVTFTWTSLNPDVATVDPASGVVTAVGNGQVAIATTVDGVTGHGLITVSDPSLAPVNLWTSTAIGTGTWLSEIWGTSSANVYAVGYGGSIMRFNGSGWALEASNTSVDLTDIWGSSDQDIYAIAYNGSVHFDGTSWSPGTPSGSDVWGAGPDAVFAVGSGGSLWHFDGTDWVQSTLLDTEALQGVWGSSAENVYAVGWNNISDGLPTVHQYDGSNWTAVNSGFTDPTMSVWGTAWDDVFIAASAGTWPRNFDGSIWSDLPAGFGTGNNQRISGTSSSDIFLSGYGSVIDLFDGSGWTRAVPPLPEGAAGGTDLAIKEVWTSPTGDVFAAATLRQTNDNTAVDGVVVRGYRGATVAVSGPSSNLVGTGEQVQLTAEAQDDGGAPIAGVTFTWGSDDELVATVDADGLVTAVGQGSATIAATANGGASGNTTITVQIPAEVAVSPTGATLTSSGATQPYTAQVLDEVGQVISPAQAPAITWSSLNTGVASIGSGTGEATAADAGQGVISATAGGITGYGLLTVAYAGAEPVSVWDTVTVTPTPGWLWSTWGRSASEVYATGATGTVLEWDGASWNAESPTTTEDVRDMWGATSSDLWTVGGGGEILRFDGTTWDYSVTSPTTVALMDIWGAAPNDIHAGGGNVLVHYDGTSWSTETNPTGASMFGFWGVSSDTVYAVGSGCTILRWNGDTWNTITTGSCTNTLYRAWGTSGSDVFMVGSSGLILHYDGASVDTMNMASPITADIRGIWGTGSNEVFAAAGALVLSWDGSSWSQMPTGATANIFDVWGTSSDDFFGGWYYGTLQGYRGLSPTNFGTDVELPSQAGWTANALIAIPITVSSVTDITHLSLIMKNGASQARLGLYSEVAGQPAQLLAETGTFSLSAAGRYEEPVVQRIRVQPGTYWIAHLYDVQTPGAYELTGGPGYYTGGSQTFADGFPATYPVASFFSGRHVNYYATGFVVP